MTIEPGTGNAGVVFDMNGGAFKFAAVLMSQNEVVIGHYAPGSGFVFDAVQSYTKHNGDINFEVTLDGDLVFANINGWGPGSLSHAYGTVVTRGQFGLLAWGGSTQFEQLQIKTNDPGLTNAPQHMLAAGIAVGPAVGETDLTVSEVDSELGAAISRLTTMLSLDAAQVAQLSSATIDIGALPDNGLGLTQDDVITLSADAAGWGWFIDPTPNNDNSFPITTVEGLAATPGSAASQGMDLLTVEMHELAHLLGYGDTTSGLMSTYLTPGVRLAPAVGPVLGPVVTVVTVPATVVVAEGTSSETLPATARIVVVVPSITGAGQGFGRGTTSLTTVTPPPAFEVVLVGAPMAALGNLATGDAARLVLGPANDVISGGDSDGSLIGTTLIQSGNTQLGAPTPGDLFRAIHDSEIVVNVRDLGAPSQGSTRAWLFDETAGALVAQQPAAFSIVLDGEGGAPGGSGGPQGGMPSVHSPDLSADVSLAATLPAWLTKLHAAARLWFDS